MKISKVNVLNYSKNFVILSVFITGIIGVLSSRGLYADGSYYLFNILQRGDFWVFDGPRSFIQFVTQIPVVFAIKLGVSDIDSLIIIHGVGLITPTLTTWILIFVNNYDSYDFWFYCIAFSISYLASGFMSIGEYNLTYALVVLCFSILIKKNNSWLAWGFSFVSSIILLRSYEAMLILAPLLFGVSLVGFLRKNKKVYPDRIFLCLHVISFFLAIILSVISLLNFRDPSNLKSASSYSIIFSEQFAYLFLMLVFYIFLHFLPDKLLKKVIFFFSVIISIFFLISPNLWIYPTMHYQFRTTTGALLFLLLFYKAAFLHFNNFSIFSFKTSFRSIPLISLLLFVTLLIPLNFHSMYFSKWLKLFEFESTLHQNWVPINETNLYKDTNEYYLYSWFWTNPSLSVVLSGRIDGGILNDSNYSGWQPFQPQDLKNNPMENYTY